jgi:mono/diheme cytochrome c family protein
MVKFIFGIIFTLVVIAVGGLAYTRLGYAPIAADQPPDQLERLVLGTAMDASVDRHAAHVPNPVPPTDQNLIQGMQVYLMNCASCHGGLDKKRSALGRSMYPPAPQLIIHGGVGDPEWHTFYVIQKGIRRTGMAGWEKMLTTDEIWKVTAFLSRLDKLPPAVKQRWSQAVPAEPR